MPEKPNEDGLSCWPVWGREELGVPRDEVAGWIVVAEESWPIARHEPSPDGHSRYEDECQRQVPGGPAREGRRPLLFGHGDLRPFRSQRAPSRSTDPPRHHWRSYFELIGVGAAYEPPGRRTLVPGRLLKQCDFMLNAIWTILRRSCYDKPMGRLREAGVRYESGSVARLHTRRVRQIVRGTRCRAAGVHADFAAGLCSRRPCHHCRVRLRRLQPGLRGAKVVRFTTLALVARRPDTATGA